MPPPDEMISMIKQLVQRTNAGELKWERAGNVFHHFSETKEGKIRLTILMSTGPLIRCRFLIQQTPSNRVIYDSGVLSVDGEDNFATALRDLWRGAKYQSEMVKAATGVNVLREILKK